MRLFLLLCFFLNVLTQTIIRTDTTKLKNKTDTISHYFSNLSMVYKNLKSDLHEVRLNSGHRQDYYSLNELLPQHMQTTINGINIVDEFSNNLDWRAIPKPFIESLYSNNYLNSYQFWHVRNINPLTEIRIIDGDFGFTDIDVNFRQRISKNFGLQLGFNNIESNAFYLGGALLYPHIRMGLDFDISSEEHIQAFYFYQKRSSAEFGYIKNDEPTFIDDSYTKKLDQFFLIYSNSTYSITNYLATSSHANTVHKNFDDDKFTSLNFQTDFNIKVNNFNHHVLYQYLKLDANYQNQLEISNSQKLSFAYKVNYADSILNYNASLKYAHNNYTSKKNNLKLEYNLNYKLFNNLSVKSYLISADLSPHINLYKGLSYGDSALSINFPNYAGQIDRKDLDDELIFTNLLSYDMFYSEFYFKTTVYVNPIKFDQGFFKTEENYAVQILGVKSIFELSNNLNLKTEIEKKVSKDLHWQSDFRFKLNLNASYILFKNLNWSSTIKFEYFGKRLGLNYLRAIDTFSKSDEVLAEDFILSYKAGFTIKKATLILEINNILKSENVFVNGYQSTNKAVLFGVEWSFLD